ncbi:4-phosphoerythronate dehydrogenase [Alistipes sp. OttesenSCG-928-B03]|nr:4-phosphoerythronate dehydrogenase [Alistipes sp. OttesenSCG-928-B03]
MKIVIDRDIPYIRGVFEPYAEVAYLSGRAIAPDDVRDAGALIVRTRTKCDRALLEGSAVRMIASATIGLDHIARDYCAAAGIEVASAPGSNARGVLQWVAAALAHASREQGWAPNDKTLGVVGVGHVGSLVADYAARWGFRVLCCDPPRQRAESAAAEFVALDRIALEADVITFHTPLTSDGEDATFHLADAVFFRTVRRGALILNSSRGEVVDSAAFADAIERGHCSACIDTWEHEPAIDRRLLDISLLATPHIAGYTAQGKANATSMVVRAVGRRFGWPLGEWYPSGDVTPTVPQPINWSELNATIDRYFDIAALTHALQSHPDDFESMRNNYDYRQEYF